LYETGSGEVTKLMFTNASAPSAERGLDRLTSSGGGVEYTPIFLERCTKPFFVQTGMFLWFRMTPFRVIVFVGT
jgi:hypothetical protein